MGLLVMLAMTLVKMLPSEDARGTEVSQGTLDPPAVRVKEGRTDETPFLPRYREATDSVISMPRTKKVSITRP